MQKALSTLNDFIDFRLLLRIGLLILLPIAGWKLGSALAYAGLNGAFVSWESISSPPGVAAKFVALTPESSIQTETGFRFIKSVFVQTELGLTYRYDLYRPKCQEECWVVS